MEFRITDNQSHQRPSKQVSEVVNVECDWRAMLNEDELLTGTPTITEVTSSDLTLSNKAVNTAALTILGEDVGISQETTFTITGGSANTDYTVQIQTTTDASNAQTLRALVQFRCEADT